MGLEKRAAQHKQIFDRMVEQAGTVITLRMPPANVSGATSAATKALGTRAQATGYGADIPVTAIVHTSLDASPLQQTGYPAGLVQISEIILAVRLADVLVDPLKPLGPTQFELAKEIVVQGTVFKKTGVERSGLPPLGPYILWVGLKGLGS